MAYIGNAVQQWTVFLALTALCLSIVVVSQLLASYASAYIAAPSEVIRLLDALDASIEENESYDRDLTRVPRLEDRLRLGRLLRDIQRGGDDLRESLGAQLASGTGVDGQTGNTATVLRLGARLLWAGTRRDMEDRLRKLDMLRMRFLVAYMGIVAEQASATFDKGSKLTLMGHGKGMSDIEKTTMVAPAASTIPQTPPPAPTHQMLTRALTEEIKSKRPPLRRLTTQAIGHHSDIKPGHQKGWAGVVEELQRSPKLKARHAEVERSIENELSKLSKLT